MVGCVFSSFAAKHTPQNFKKAGRTMWATQMMQGVFGGSPKNTPPESSKKRPVLSEGVVDA
jgi:hypothetical protein